MWEAIVNPRHVAKWWGPKGFSTTIESMDVRPDGEWKLVMHGPDGTDYHNKSVFTEVVKLERLVYQHLEPIHKFQMTMILDSQAGGTRLTWRMFFESVEECARLKNFISDANEQNFDRLQAHLSEMAPDREIVITREFHAPRELVW